MLGDDQGRDNETMTKLSDMITAYATRPFLKARLKIRIKLDDGTIYRKGTVSELLIDKGNGTYHFEAKGSACTVTDGEIELIDRR
jgi:hypothetical protein